MNLDSTSFSGGLHSGSVSFVGAVISFVIFVFIFVIVAISKAATSSGRNRLAPHPDDHRNPADIGQRLAGKARRGHAGGDQNDRSHRNP